MSESIDDRVVSMQFDNQAFERNIATTLTSLGKLQKSLDFANSTRNMNELQAASSRFNLSGMGSAVEGISTKFLALSTIAITTLATITAKAIETGTRMAGAFTFKPVVDGFQEYETNMNSIQTILANTSSKGSKLADVNKALGQLNEYSDQTIYNFSQMARNVGTFTAAGIDLDKSVSAIKGIANLAAISGSNSEQASTAMYQLSQALAAGKVSLMDWNSVVNAGMGGEIFKKALFETGKAMKTITDVPVGASFEEWEKKGGTFREQMEKGWITADVLSTTLNAFSGDLSKASLISMGFTEAQAAEMERLGKLGISAATEVKTLTQLMGTLKEAAGSGWAKSFSIVFGEFDEAKELFTNLSDSIGGFIKKTSDARNALLQGWKDLGGRQVLIDTLGKAFGVIAPILDRLGKAFRDVFPPMTAQRLLDLTKGLGRLFDSMTLSIENADKLRRVFVGVFAILEIGWTVIKETALFFKDLFTAMAPKGSPVLDFTAKIGDMALALNKLLVEGGGIRNFFNILLALVTNPVESIKNLVGGIGSFSEALTKVSQNQAVAAVLGRIEDRFGSLSTATERISDVWERLSNVFGKFANVLDTVWTHIRTWFSELGTKLANSMSAGDFDAAVDIVNVGLLGGIILLLKKFVSGDFLKDLGGGLFSKVEGVLDGLTGQLKAMQANVKADTLLKIALAVGALTASVLVLSLIDSGALTKALTAMATGFGELVGTMAILNTVAAGPKGAAKLGILVAGMIGMASAMLVLSGAITVLSVIDPGALAKGLAGMSAGIAAMVLAMNLISANPGQMLAASVSMVAMATALTILAGAIKLYSMMSGEELAKGLAAIAGALLIIGVAMNLFPVAATLAAGVAMIPLAIGLGLLAGAVKLFGMLSWGEIGKGLVGIAGALLIIAAAMNLMPITLPITAAGLLILSIALGVMAKVIETMGNLKMGELAKGLGALAIMLGILVVAVNLMSGALAGAASLVVVSGALLILTHVLQELGGMKLGDLAKGLGAIAAVLALLGVGALLLVPALGPMIALGAALLLIGAGFALFGSGAYLVTKALESLAKAGVAGVKALVEAIKIFLTAVPTFAGALVKAILSFVTELVAAAPLLLKAITVLLIQILDTVIELVPKIAEALGKFITIAAALIIEKAPELIAAGFALLIALLKGIRDNIVEITTLAIDILIRFASTLSDNAQRLVDAGINLLTKFIESISNRMNEIVGLGLTLVLSIVEGLVNNVFRVVEEAINIVIAVVDTIVREAVRMVRAGAEAVIKLAQGVSENIWRVIDAAKNLVLAFLRKLGESALDFARAAADLVISFLNGLAEVIRQRAPELRQAGANVASAIIEGMTGGLSSRARDVANAAINVASGALGGVMRFIQARSPSKKFAKVGGYMAQGLAKGFDDDITATNSAVAQAERIIEAFQKTLAKVPISLEGLGDLSPIISPVLDLTQVRMASRDIGGLLEVPLIRPDVSYDQARLISRETNLTPDFSETAAPVVKPTEIKFEQNNYSPKALSTGDVYRYTKSQIALAKEELRIP